MMGGSLTREVDVSLSVAEVPRNVTFHADADGNAKRNTKPCIFHH